MAANSRFDLSLSSPDGPSYSNGQRGSYSTAPLERLGSFREGSDRILSSTPGTSKANATSSQGDMTGLLQSLASDLKVIAADHRLNRPGEMKRAVTSIFGASANDASSVAFGTKPLSSSCLEEIKRLKNNLQDTFTKARDRVKIFGDASSKIEKFCHNILRKRSRVDSLSGERSTGLNQGSIPKTGTQSHLSGCVLDIGSQRLEDKAKINVPNRRIRTSLVEANGTSRASGPLERDKDILKSANGSAAQGDENDRAFPTVVDGWETSRMRKKRSVIKSDASASSGLVKSQGDRETKRGMQQKLGIDARPKLNYSQCFRSGSNNNNTTLVGKIDSSTQQNAPSMRSKNEQNHVSVPNDRRDARFCPDTESASLRLSTKPNSREDTCAASPTLSKFGSVRGPRSNSGSLSKTSPNIHRVVGNPEDLEPPQTLGVINRKRSASVRSSSPPVGQWAVPRPQKISRSSRRSSLSPLISSHDELSVSETVEDASINHDDLAGIRRASSNASQQNKMRGDNFASASLSESEESGVQENKLKDKVKKCTDLEGKPGQTVQKFSNVIMPTRKNRMAVEEDCGDAERRQGKIGRGFAPARSGMSATIEKLSDVVTTKQQRSARHGSERVESKPGRPPIKKPSERKSYARPRQLINSLSLESSDEAADDHEELVAAATAALDTGRTCSGSFWKQVEPVFSFASTEDTTFLREQIDQEHALLSTATVTSRCESNAFSNGVNFYGCERETVFAKETMESDPLLEQFMRQSGSYSGVSICQALISAIIEEDDMDNIYNTIDYGEAYSCNDSYVACFELDKDLETKGLNLQPLEDCQTTGRNLDYYKVDANQRFRDEISRERSGTNGILETVNRPLSSLHQGLNQLTPNQTTPFSTDCTELLYNQMTINDRLILELSGIGLYPKHVPDLTFGEEEDITKGIHALEEKLHEQGSKRRNLLLKLEKAVMDAKGLQQRKLERLAMDRLVLMAYDRYMSCWGPTASGSKNVNKFVKHAALAFIKRTLARCKKFEETNISCFHEPVFRDIFLSPSSRSIDLQVTDLPADASQITRRLDTHAKSSNTARSINPPLEHPFSKEETWSNRIKKKEVLLDDVVGNTSGPSSRTTPGFGSSLVSGAKGKRSERDRDGKGHNRDSVFKNTTAKIGRPATSICKGERKNKTKPKVKTTQLSASVNVLHSNATDISGSSLSFSPTTSGSAVRDVKEKEDLNLLPGAGTKKSSNETDPIDLSSLQIPDMDVVDFGGQGQDIASWLNFDEEGMQDQDDFMGLEIPMDDLSEVHLMI